MAFVKEAESVWARMHLRSARGLTIVCIVLLALGAAGIACCGALRGAPAAFTVDRSEALAAEGDPSGSGMPEDSLSVVNGSESVSGSEAGVGVESDPGRSPASDAAMVSDSSSDTVIGAGAASGAFLYVHVGGCVNSPGLHRVETGSRVQDAIDAAGGVAEGGAPDALNLARRLEDGERIIVPTLEAYESVVAGEPVEQAAGPDVGASSPSAGSSAAAARVNINTATAEQLQALPGIGPATAQKIVADRQTNGPFASPDDLKRVSGIGDKKYEALADAICVG